MKVQLKWFLTGKVSEFADRDEIIGPQTTMLELKGLIQIRFGFKPSETLLIHEHLLENDMTLREVGIVNQKAADETIITVHVVRNAGLEKPNAIGGQAAASASADEAADDDDDDEGIQEFSHEDMIVAMRMLGKTVPVSSERLREVRADAPRARPAFLNAPPTALPQQPSQQPSQRQPERQPQPAGLAATSGTVPVLMPHAPPPSLPDREPPRAGAPPSLDTPVHRIFREVRYGLRADGAEDRFAIVYPGATEPFQYWDCRLPEDTRHNDLCLGREVCLELFYFGEFKLISDGAAFNALVQQTLARDGIKARTPLPVREAGCMYPLVAVTVLLADVDAMELGAMLFDDFGTALPSTAAAHSGNGGSSGGGGGGCAQQ